ncbi:MAG: hypothetical protein MJ164_03325 [Alphaproteobacteria bacterium]|nr:hypothetical protein [Alphaproteobacteria bacterium]
MKKILKTVAFATVGLITTGAMAGVTKNMENPLYIPTSGEFYSKTSAGIMYKKADHTYAMRKKGAAGDPEFPVWRAFEDFGYGITDRASAYVSLGWTQNDDIDRYGMHRARLGANYRVVETTDDFVWDVYAEAYLAGLSKMKGAFDLVNGFKYDNFSSGRWGVVAGTKIGKKWSRLTASLSAEYLQIFGNHNNEIDVSAVPPLALAGIEELSVDLKSNDEWIVSADAFYQLDDRWSVGGSFAFIEHADNGVKSIHTDVSGVSQQAIKGLLNEVQDMQDGWEEYCLRAVLANQITDSVQLALYGEYMFDRAHAKSQNGTDIKAELGVRANVRF